MKGSNKIAQKFQQFVVNFSCDNVSYLHPPPFVSSSFAVRSMEISGKFPDGTLNAPYNSFRDVTCNFTSYNKLEVISGTLPPGLSFSGKIVTSRIIITGTPTEEGSYTFTIRLTNYDFPEATATQNFTINIAYDEKYDPKARSSISGEFPDGRVGALYHSTTAVTFNWSGCKWEVEDGELPPGLRLKLLGFQGYNDEYSYDTILPTDHNADLRGTPTKAGEYTFTVRATRRDDDRFTATKTFTIIISERGNEPDPDPDPDNPNPNPDPDPDDPGLDPNPDPSPDPEPSTGGSGGGGCDSGLGILSILAMLLIMAKGKR